MIYLTEKNNRIIFQRRDELIVIEPYGPNCLRFRATRNGSVSDESWTLKPPAPGAECTIAEGKNEITITNGDLSAYEASHIYHLPAQSGH